MKKYSNTILMVLFLSFGSTAQFSFGLDGGFIKSTEENSELLPGGDIAFKYDLSETFRAGINISVYQKSDDIGSLKVKSSLMPIAVSGEYIFLEDKLRPYAGIHLGIIRSGYTIGSNGVFNNNVYFAPVAGIDYRLMGSIGINVHFKYGFAFYKNDISDEIDNFSTISPNIGVTYTL